jgi:hypothetical protein
MPAVMNSGETMEPEKDKKFYQMSIKNDQEMLPDKLD